MDEKKINIAVSDLLSGGLAHATAKDILSGVEAKYRTKKPSEEMHSLWQELEHLRIAQEDILRYTLDKEWVSPEWPEEYWPAESETVTDDDWESSVSSFFSDMQELINIAEGDRFDLSSEIPWGEGRTYIRQLLLAADHNSYHLSKFVTIRKMLGIWK